MATTRQSIVRGPGTVTFNGVRLFDASGVSAEIDSATGEIPSSIAGTLDVIKTDQVGKVSLTPVGSLSEDLLAVLYPAWARVPEIGRSVLGAADQPLVVASKAGVKVTFAAAALTKCPDLLLSPVKTAFGPAEFSALVANGRLPSEAGALHTVASAAYADGEPPRDGLSGFHYQGSYGSLSIPDTLDGWTVSVELGLEPVHTDSQGTIDYTLSGVNVTARCTPLGLSEAQILAALPVGLGRGASLATASDLVVSAKGGLKVTLKCASLLTGPLNWGATALRAGELGFRANVDPATGSLFDVALQGDE
ncbi:MAG: hypothetical protein ACI4RA_05535 [Kiritimatiellia bacterium]